MLAHWQLKHFRRYWTIWLTVLQMEAGNGRMVGHAVRARERKILQMKSKSVCLSVWWLAAIAVFVGSAFYLCLAAIQSAVRLETHYDRVVILEKAWLTKAGSLLHDGRIDLLLSTSLSEIRRIQKTPSGRAARWWLDHNLDSHQGSLWKDLDLRYSLRE